MGIFLFRYIFVIVFFFGGYSNFCRYVWILNLFIGVVYFFYVGIFEISVEFVSMVNYWSV